MRRIRDMQAAQQRPDTKADIAHRVASRIARERIPPRPLGGLTFVEWTILADRDSDARVTLIRDLTARMVSGDLEIGDACDQAQMGAEELRSVVRAFTRAG